MSLTSRVSAQSWVLITSEVSPIHLIEEKIATCLPCSPAEPTWIIYLSCLTSIAEGKQNWWGQSIPVLPLSAFPPSEHDPLPQNMCISCGPRKKYTFKAEQFEGHDLGGRMAQWGDWMQRLGVSHIPTSDKGHTRCHHSLLTVTGSNTAPSMP